MHEKINTSLPLAIENSIFYKGFLIRRVEEKLLELYNLGDLHGTVHTCVGQELVGAVISEFIHKEDAVFSNHRCHGHFLSLTQDIQGLIAEIYGKTAGVCGGKGGSQHLHKHNFYSNGIQGGIVPVAAGLAMGKKLKNINKIGFVFIGDGTLGEGVVYETFNIISKWHLPLVIVLENNFYAQSTHQQEVLAGHIRARAEAFGIKSAHTNTWDYSKLYWTAEDIIHYTRTTSCPSFLQIDTYRLNAHSKGDDTREKEEINHHQSIDPLNIAFHTNPSYKKMVQHIDDMITEAVSFARNAQTATHTLPILTPLIWCAPNVKESNQPLRVSAALNTAFKKLMKHNTKIYFIGEDVRDPYGGAFKISKGLSELFPDRVLNTPISEGAIVGLGNGLALEGYLPIIEIMFGDFITLALDQIINHAAKFRYMYHQQVKVPIIIRTPMGGGRGYGPTHSQTLDRHILGVPGLRIIALNHMLDPIIVYQTLLHSSEDPTIVIENKTLYTQYLQEKAPQGFQYHYIAEPSPMMIVEPESSYIDCNIVAYGGLSHIIMEVLKELFLEHELVVQFICPLQIYPFDIKVCEKFIQRSKQIVLIEEGQGFANFSTEFLTQYITQYSAKDMRFKCVASASTPIPSSKDLETETLIQHEHIVNAVLSFLNE